jgi:hypothetical protein
MFFQADPAGYFDPKISNIKELDIDDIGGISAKVLIPGITGCKISLLKDLVADLCSLTRWFTHKRPGHNAGPSFNFYYV